METHEHIMAYYPLFEHMQNEHGLTLLESELDEIIRLSDEVKERYNKASGGECSNESSGLNIPPVIKSVCDHKAPRRIVFGEHRCSKCGMLIGHN